MSARRWEPCRRAHSFEWRAGMSLARSAVAPQPSSLDCVSAAQRHNASVARLGGMPLRKMPSQMKVEPEPALPRRNARRRGRRLHPRPTRAARTPARTRQPWSMQRSPGARASIAEGRSRTMTARREREACIARHAEPCAQPSGWGCNRRPGTLGQLPPARNGRSFATSTKALDVIRTTWADAHASWLQSHPEARARSSVSRCSVSSCAAASSSRGNSDPPAQASVTKKESGAREAGGRRGHWLACASQGRGR